MRVLPANTNGTGVEMPADIYMVKLGMTMTEGTVAEWHIPDGGEVKTGEDLYRLETEKVEMEVEAEASGTVRHLVPEETTVDPGAIVGYIYAPGEEIPAELPGADAPAAAAPAPARVSPVAAPVAAAAAQGGGGRVAASPAARRLAKELGVELASVTATGPRGRVTEDDVRTAHEAAAAPAPAAPMAVPASPLARKRAQALGVDLAVVRGTGPGGRITKGDVETAANVATATAATGETPPAAMREDEVLAVRGMRKVIAERMYASLQSTAQLTMDMDVAMDDCVRLRTQLVEEWSDEGVRPSYTDIVMKAVAKALLGHPRMNAQFSDTELTLRGEVNVGMAVALEEGLVVPVLRHVDQLGLKEIAMESSRLAAAAREGSLGLDDMAGGTFTVSTLGMFGVDSFTPILNPPEAGILGVNRLRDSVRWEGETPVRQKAMTLSLTWDHRALDGAPAAQFLASVRDYLEAPFRLLV